MIIYPAKSLKGKIALPGDKSISHRAAMLSAMAEGTTTLENFATSADCASTLNCLEGLGIRIERSGNNIWLEGKGKRGFRRPESPLDCGNSGTTMRLLSGILAGQDFDSTLAGDESLSSRPMKRVAAPLELMGAKIASKEGHAPLVVSGRNPLSAIEYATPIASAQVKSCVLLAGLYSDGKTSVAEKTPTRDHTERMLRWFGADLEIESLDDGQRISISGDSRLIAKNISIPSDISSAAFFMAAASCLDDSEVLLPNTGLNPSRNGIIEVLQRFGADISILHERMQCNEPVGDIRVRGKKRLGAANSNILCGSIIPNIIDEIPVLAVFGTQVERGIEIRDAKELRVKESDRISTTAENLRLMGAEVEEFEDGLKIHKSRLKGTRLPAHGDHRIAMAFSIAALFAEGETTIEGAECAAVSFPGFYDSLASLSCL